MMMTVTSIDNNEGDRHQGQRGQALTATRTTGIDDDDDDDDDDDGH
jgi:hypothetical protein